MFRNATTFIVGAGASVELGLPSGDQLRDRIVKLLTTTNAKANGFEDDVMGAAVQEHLGIQRWMGQPGAVRACDCRRSNA